MVNLQINGAKLAEDTEMAKKIIEGKVDLKAPNTFHKYSRVYVTTNENLSHEICRESFTDRKKVLSITASGDQILNLILYGGKDITGIDICSLTKYYVALKIAAIETLNRNEYLLFMAYSGIDNFLDNDFYKRIRNNLTEEARTFWDEIYKRYSGEDIYYSPLLLFDGRHHSAMIDCNPFLQGNNYDLLKEKIKKARIMLSDKNIFELSKSDFGEFDLIFLSNVLDYIFEFQKVKDIGKTYQDFLSSLPLSEDGLAFSYNLLVDPTKYLKEENFKFFNQGYSHIITYQKK